MKNIKIYLENGQVIITSAVAASSKLNSSITNAPVVNTYPSNGALTASIVNTNEIKVVNSNGTVVLNNIPFAKLVGKDGSTAIGASAAAVLSDLNSTSYFAATPIDPKVDANKSLIESEAAKILALKNSTKTDAGDRGVFVNDGKATTYSHVSVKTADSAIQAGQHTAIKLNEVGAATLTLSVQAGPTGNKSSVDAITVTGNTNGTNALTTFNQSVDFDSNTVTGLTSSAIPALSASKITSGTFTTGRIPSLNTSKIGSGTLADARVAASNVTQHQASLSITESQISDLSHYADASVDTHLNQSSASSGQYLKWTGTDYAWGTVSSGGLGNVVEDTSPQLGGQLDANGQSIDMGTNTITDTKVGQWDTAYGWGDHSTEGYLTTLAFSALTGKPTTIAGYGITDALVLGTTGTTALAGNTSLFDGAYGSLSGTPSTFAPSAHNHAASEITSGTFSTARIPSLAASKITSGTLANARISEGSVTQHQAALSVTESQISDLQSYLTTVPAQSFASLTGKPTTVAGYGITDAFASLAGDTSPQLGGDLDVDGNKITSNNNGDVTIDPAGTGAIVLRSDNIQFEGAGSVSMSSLKFYEASAAGSNFVAFKAALTLTSDTTWTLPSDDGTSGQVIKTNGSGTLSFGTVLPQDNPTMKGLVNIQELTGALPGKLKIFDSGNSHGVTLQAPDLTADVGFTLPAADGTSGQVLKTDGSGNLSFVAQTADTNTNLGNTDMTLSGSRIVTMGHDLNFKVGSSSKLLYDTSANSGFGIWQFSAPTQFLHDVTFNGAGGTTQASIKFNEPSMGGSNGVILQGPSTNMTSDLTFTLPDTDGTSGQVLQTDGSGVLSFVTASGGGGGGMTETPFVSMSGRASWGTADTEERVLIGTSYGWSFYNQTVEMGDWSSSDTINSTTYSLAAYLRAQSALQMTSDEKKVRMKVTYRVQNGNSTDFGFSIWSGAVDNDSTSSTNVTLRGACATQTVGTSSITAYKKEFTTTSTITDDAVFLTVEQRGGGAGLTTTCYVYYNIHLFLVD